MYRSLSSVGVLFNRIIKGVGAVISQPYDEVNKKRGKQWEISRSIPFTNIGDKAYSVLRVGAVDVDMKARILGATGGGVIGRAYRIQASDVDLTGSTPDKWYNYNDKILTQPLTEIYPEREVTFITPITSLAVEGNKMHADIFAITNIQNQGKGFTPSEFGGNHIHSPDTYVLYEIESFDASQTAIAKLEMYEGELDFYPG